MTTIRIWFVTLTFILCASMAEGQTSTGTILGNVYDASKAVVSGALVTLTEQATHEARTQTSGADGSFGFRALAVGTYTLEVDHAGFAKEVVTGIVLDVAETRNIDVSLRTANQTETVTVSSERPLLQVADSSLSSVIGQAQVATLPLNGRNILQLSQLAAGVDTAPKGSATERQGNYGPGFFVGGQRETTNTILVDGVEISGMELNNYPLAVPPIDDVEEFRVQTSNYSAEFGGNSGAFVNIATKRGTNQFHGVLFEYLKNNDFDARNYLSTTVSPLKRSQFGGVAGGPIVLPWFYNGRNKSFWEVSYEGIRQSNSVSSTALVPTAAERAGNFSGTGTTIVDPLTKVPYPNDTIPQNLINPVGLGLINEYPLPNNPSSATANYIGAPAQSFDNDLISARIDHQIAARDTAFARFTINQPTTTSPGQSAAFSGYNQIQADWNLQLVLGNTLILTPHIVNETNIGYVRFDRNRISEASNTKNWVQELGIQGFTVPPNAWGAPEVSPQGLNSVGYGTVNAVLTWSSQSIQAIDNLSIEHGHHTFKTGMTLNFKNLGSQQYTSPNGVYSFSGEFSAQHPVQLTTSANAVADLLLGWPSGYTLQTGPYLQRFTYPQLAFYFQDDWAVTPNLTINMGLRWEYFGKPVDRNNNIATFNLATGQQVLAGQSGSPLPRSLIYPDYKNFAPRLGFGWRIPGRQNMSVRGAYGLFFAPEIQGTYRELGFQNPFGTTYTLSIRPINPNAPLPVFSVQNPLAGANPLVSFNTVYGINPHWRDMYTGEWNLSVQDMLKNNLLVEVAYRGSQTDHLSSILNYNQTNPFPAQPPNFTLNYPYPTFGTINYFDSNGAGNYNALQLRVQKQLSHGLALMGAFTWNKDLTNADSTSAGVSASPGNASTPQVISPLSLNWGNAVESRPKELTASGIYALPFLLHNPSIAARMLGGWSLGFDSTFSDGAWLTPSSYGVANAGSRANLTGNPNLPRTQRTHLKWYNTSLVTNPAPGQLGNSSKGTIMGSGTNVTNVVLSKSFAITEGQKLEFRSEFFNLFNHTQFDDPNTYANANPQAGVITSASDYGYAQTERIIQLVLRYNF